MEKKNNKLTTGVVIGIILLGVFLILIFNIKTNNSAVNNLDSLVDTKIDETNEYSTLMENIDMTNLSSLREQITLNDITKLYAVSDYDSDNPLIKLGKEFVTNLNEKNTTPFTKKVDGGLSIDTLGQELGKLDTDLVRNFKLYFNIYDYSTKNRVVGDTLVYVNGVKVGTTNNGIFSGEFAWPIGIEKFNVLVRNSNYGDGFLTLNSINSEGELLFGDIFMKDAISEEVALGTETEIDFGDFKLGLEECSISGANGGCSRESVSVKTNFISGTEVVENNSLVDMTAIDSNGEVVYLKSGGMAFVDMIDKDGNILDVNDRNKVTIMYKVSDEEIANMDDFRYGAGNSNGYWWYDKNAGIWRYDEDVYFELDRENGVWLAEIDVLY